MLQDLLFKLIRYIMVKVVSVHGSSRQLCTCHFCLDIVPEWSVSSKLMEAVSKDRTYHEEFIVPKLMMTLKSCHKPRDWDARRFVHLHLLCHFLETTRGSIGIVYEPLILLFAQMSVSQVVDETLSEKYLEVEVDWIMERLYSGDDRGMLLYALEKDFDAGGSE
jgi:hypothetical protein